LIGIHSEELQLLTEINGRITEMLHILAKEKKLPADGIMFAKLHFGVSARMRRWFALERKWKHAAGAQR